MPPGDKYRNPATLTNNEIADATEDSNQETVEAWLWVSCRAWACLHLAPEILRRFNEVESPLAKSMKE